MGLDPIEAMAQRVDALLKNSKHPPNPHANRQHRGFLFGLRLGLTFDFIEGVAHGLEHFLLDFVKGWFPFGLLPGLRDQFEPIAYVLQVFA